MKKEIERKYTIKFVPDDMKIEKIENIEQIYIYHDKKTLIRIRKSEEKSITNYIYTLKTKGDLPKSDTTTSKVYEIESNISKEEYEKLSQKRISGIINKTRLTIPIRKPSKS